MPIIDQSSVNESSPTPPDAWADPRNFAVLLFVIKQRTEIAEMDLAK
jgi:hypothetical protein